MLVPFFRFTLILGQDGEFSDTHTKVVGRKEVVYGGRARFHTSRSWRQSQNYFRQEAKVINTYDSLILAIKH